MIDLRNLVTGERQFVASLAGIDLTVWEDTGGTTPSDLESRRYSVISGALVGTSAPLSKPAFMDLWTVAETLAVAQSADPLMAYIWIRTLAWDDVFVLSDSRVEAGIVRAEELGILTPERAAQIRAGEPY